NEASLKPCLRHSSLTGVPAAACFRKPMICSSVYRFFMSVLSSDGLYLDQVGPEIGGAGQGQDVTLCSLVRRQRTCEQGGDLSARVGAEDQLSRPRCSTPRPMLPRNARYLTPLAVLPCWPRPGRRVQEGSTVAAGGRMARCAPHPSCESLAPLRRPRRQRGA